MMKIECVVVSVNYGDFLSVTLPTNRSLFDKMVVVTSPEDERSRLLCEFWHVQTVVSDACYRDGSKLNKGAMINEGLRALDGDGWVVHMDADIFVPPLFRHIFERLELDEDGLYHADRLMCRDWKDWMRFWMRPVLINEANIFVHPRPFPLGVRLAKTEYGGFLPLGYFQCWNQGRKKITYPEQHTDVARTDIQLARLFSRRHRHLLPEVFLIHVETPGIFATMGQNWQGRTTPEFGGRELWPEESEAHGSEEGAPRRRAA